MESEAVEAPGDFIAHKVTKSRTYQDAARLSGRAQFHHGGEERVVSLTCGSEMAATQRRETGWSAKGGRGTRRAGLAIGPREGGGLLRALGHGRRESGFGPKEKEGGRGAGWAFQAKI